MGGPNNDKDYITVVPVEFPDSKYGKYQYTKIGNPLNLAVPDSPGVYELRYISGQSRSALARRMITVNDVSATLKAPESAYAGSPIQIEWQGPNNEKDYITVVPPDYPDSKYGQYEYTNKGSNLTLPMPDKDGMYELRYVSGQSRIVLARRPVASIAVSAHINALNVASTKQMAHLEWEGPNNKRDYITVVPPEYPDNKYGKYIYTDQGSPKPLQMPEEPGNYELRYVTGQSNSVLTRRLVNVVPETDFPDLLATSPKGNITLTVLDAAGQPISDGVTWTVYGIGGIGQGDENSQ